MIETEVRGRQLGLSCGQLAGLGMFTLEIELTRRRASLFQKSVGWQKVAVALGLTMSGHLAELPPQGELCHQGLSLCWQVRVSGV